MIALHDGEVMDESSRTVDDSRKRSLLQRPLLVWCAAASVEENMLSVDVTETSVMVCFSRAHSLTQSPSLSRLVSSLCVLLYCG